MKGNFHHISKNFEKWGSSSNGQKEKTRKKAWAKEIVVKFFSLCSLLCPLFLLLLTMNYRFCFNLRSDVSRGIEKSSLTQDPPGGSVLLFSGHDRINTRFKWGAKIGVSFFHASYLYLNELITFVNLLDFRENWPECSRDINAQRVWGFEEIRIIFLVTSRSVTATEIFPIG